MPSKPTYQDLLKRIKTLEKEAEGRRKAEEELREGREHLRSLMESASNFAVAIQSQKNKGTRITLEIPRR